MTQPTERYVHVEANERREGKLFARKVGTERHLSDARCVAERVTDAESVDLIGPGNQFIARWKVTEKAWVDAHGVPVQFTGSAAR